MKKFYLFSIFLALCVSALAQTVTLTFIGKDANNNWVQLDRVVITNQTRNWSETIVWPDTTLTMQNVTGIENHPINGGLSLSQNNPNPFNGITDVLLSVADAGTVNLEIADLNGRVVETQNFASLSTGKHQFRISLPSAGTYLLTVRQNGKTSSIKMVNNGGGNGKRIEHTGMVEANNYSSLQTKSGTRGVTTNPFAYGDVMEYVMYATINGIEDSVVVSQQQSDAQVIVMAFETAQTDGLPCPGTPTFTDIDGNVYNTIMFGQQCWMKENLRTTRFADGGNIPAIDTLSSINPYRYAPDGEVANVATYGYLYNWAAVMHGVAGTYNNPSGIQGICPDGWHVPSIAEWTQLTDYVGSREGYLCHVENSLFIGKALATTTGWNTDTENYCAVGNDPSSNNATGFSIPPAGAFGTGAVGGNPNYYHNFSDYEFFWTASEYNATYSTWLLLRYYSAGITNFNFGTLTKVIGGSVRCVRN